MAVEFTVTMADRPGALAEMGFVLEEAGVDIKAVHAMVVGEQGFVALIPDKVEAAAAALDKAGFPYTTREVLIVNVLNKPGSLAEVALVMADAGINIEAFYVMTDGYVIMAVDDLPGAIEVASGMAVQELR